MDARGATYAGGAMGSSHNEEEGWSPAHWQPDMFREQGMHSDTSAGVNGKRPGYSSDDLFLSKFGPVIGQQPSVAALQTCSHLGGSPAHLSGAATPNKEQARAVGSIGPPNLTTSPQRPQGPGSASNSNHSLFKPVGVPAQNNQSGLSDGSGFNGASHLINLDTTPESPRTYAPHRGRGGEPGPARQNHIYVGQGQGQDWAPNMRPGGGLPNTGPMLDDLTDRMSGMNMGVSQHQHMNSKPIPSNMAALTTVNPNMPTQMMQQGQLPRTGPSKLSMMTNQQLMMLSHTV